jgi:hypothetical protein
MSKAFKLIVILIFPFFGFSQSADTEKWSRFPNLYDNPYKSFQAKSIIGLKTSVELSTNGISNDFIYPFLLGDKLEKAVIDNTLDRKGRKNLSFEGNYEMNFVNLKSKVLSRKNIHWYLKVGQNQQVQLNANTDAMSIVFKGNTGPVRYKFENCNFYIASTNKLGGGVFIHEDKKSKPYNLSFGVFAIQVQNYGNIETKSGNYYEGNEDSFLIGVNYNAAFAGDNKLSGDGLGLGAEIMFNQKLTSKTNWGFSLENFGFANFNNSTTTYSGKGEYMFDGVYIADVGRLNESDYFENQLDSFTKPLINKAENEDKAIFLAPISRLYFVTHLKSGYYQISLRHRGTRSIPIAELRYFNFIHRSLLLGVSVGTVGNYYLNTDINWSIKSRLFLQLGIAHLESILLPKKLGGLGANAGLQFVF